MWEITILLLDLKLDVCSPSLSCFVHSSLNNFNLLFYSSLKTASLLHIINRKGNPSSDLVSPDETILSDGKVGCVQGACPIITSDAKNTPRFLR